PANDCPGSVDVLSCPLLTRLTIPHHNTLRRVATRPIRPARRRESAPPLLYPRAVATRAPCAYQDSQRRKLSNQASLRPRATRCDLLARRCQDTVLDLHKPTIARLS